MQADAPPATLLHRNSTHEEKLSLFTPSGAVLRSLAAFFWLPLPPPASPHTPPPTAAGTAAGTGAGADPDDDPDGAVLLHTVATAASQATLLVLSARALRLLRDDRHARLNVVHAGLRTFVRLRSRGAAECACQYRVCQEAVPLLLRCWRRQLRQLRAAAAGGGGGHSGSGGDSSGGGGSGASGASVGAPAQLTQLLLLPCAADMELLLTRCHLAPEDWQTRCAQERAGGVQPGGCVVLYNHHHGGGGSDGGEGWHSAASLGAPVGDVAVAAVKHASGSVELVVGKAERLGLLRALLSVQGLGAAAPPALKAPEAGGE